MRYRLATWKDFTDGWHGIREVCGPVVATILMAILLITYPISGWIRKD